jgi:diketogulonate reductase-like aldo/keto reductase
LPHINPTWNTRDKSGPGVKETVEKTIASLGVGYLDLYLIHAPPVRPALKAQLSPSHGPFFRRSI